MTEIGGWVAAKNWQAPRDAWPIVAPGGASARIVCGIEKEGVFFGTFNLNMLEELLQVRSFCLGPNLGFQGDTILMQLMQEVVTRAGKYVSLLLVLEKADEAMLSIGGIPAGFTVFAVCGSVYKHAIRAPEYVVMAANHDSSPQ